LIDFYFDYRGCLKRCFCVDNVARVGGGHPFWAVSW